jgi:hypothetical protein
LNAYSAGLYTIFETSHLVQTYFYYLCLTFILPPSFIPALTTAVWLPSGVPSSIDSSMTFPSLETLHPTPVAPLVPPLTELIFIRLPAILSAAYSEIPWHFNPLCRTCPFSSTCRERVEKEEGLGKAGEVSLSDADELRGFMKLARGVPSTIDRHRDVEIEDLVENLGELSVKGTSNSRVSELAQLRRLLIDERSMNYMATKWPASSKKIRRILALEHRDKPRASSPSNNRESLRLHSPMIEAALTNTPQVWLLN